MNGDDRLSEEQLKKLQSVLLEMLIELDGICRKHRINYTLSGGTMLGAIRHRGFIPWDDDVDVSMLRVDYDKFREKCKTELNQEKYFFQDNTTDSEYPWGYGRLRRLNSEFIRKGQEHMKMRTGIFLDIFPNDYIPNFYPQRLIHSFCCFAVRKILYSESGKIAADSKLQKTIYRVISKIPRKTAFMLLDKLKIRKPSKYCRCLTFPPPKNRHLGTSTMFFEEYIDVYFEDHCFLATKYYKEYLRYKYGDFMQLPPPKKRHCHLAAKISFPGEGKW